MLPGRSPAFISAVTAAAEAHATAPGIEAGTTRPSTGPVRPGGEMGVRHVRLGLAQVHCTAPDTAFEVHQPGNTRWRVAAIPGKEAAAKRWSLQVLRRLRPGTVRHEISVAT